VKEDIYNRLTESKLNAWAIWEDESMDLPGLSRPEISKYLKPGIIFLGLNPSKSLKTIRNFHSNSVGDKRLKEAIQNGDLESAALKNLVGGFMTDLTDTVESDSSKVDLKEHSFHKFEQILQVLGEDQYHIICFGGKTYETAKNWLLNQKAVDKDVLSCETGKMPYVITLYKVMHYSYRYGENKVGEQLNRINESIGGKFS